MYNTRPGLLIGFHGCDESRQQELLADPSKLPKSEEAFDWLGNGMYFWENNYQRAMKWALDKQQQGRIKKAAVIGAVIDLGYCCDFLDSQFIHLISGYHSAMVDTYQKAGKEIPTNKDAISDVNNDLLVRFLDCAVIEFMHSKIKSAVRTDISVKGYSNYKIFDSLRGVYVEGAPAFDGAGLKSKSHIQICVRNPNCIKGYFLKREEIDFVSEELTR